jgi:hypothetical protein
VSTESIEKLDIDIAKILSNYELRRDELVNRVDLISLNDKINLLNLIRTQILLMEIETFKTQPNLVFIIPTCLMAASTIFHIIIITKDKLF